MVAGFTQARPSPQQNDTSQGAANSIGVKRLATWSELGDDPQGVALLGWGNGRPGLCCMFLSVSECALWRVSDARLSVVHLLVPRSVGAIARQGHDRCAKAQAISSGGVNDVRAVHSQCWSSAGEQESSRRRQVPAPGSRHAARWPCADDADEVGLGTATADDGEDMPQPGDSY